MQNGICTYSAAAGIGARRGAGFCPTGEAFRADKTYDTNELLDMLKEADVAAVLPPVKSWKERTAMNCIGHGIENIFCALSDVCFSIFQSTLSKTPDLPRAESVPMRCRRAADSR
ncbi:hypothetical protein [Treponema endosymbiont of Eucomonympha sp.]|uniref:hypothetical protein n=1 Tax=Treponema endosymbiont of Eucomonympha sp. TaxID=1580831 RepID=UPI001396ABA9|nr:hypothetical protein [Treponema endosymbiont of Eucomonympha sp.]